MNYLYHVCVSVNGVPMSFPITSPIINTIDKHDDFIEDISMFIEDRFWHSTFAVLSVSALHPVDEDAMNE